MWLTCYNWSVYCLLQSVSWATSTISDRPEHISMLSDLPWVTPCWTWPMTKNWSFRWSLRSLFQCFPGALSSKDLLFRCIFFHLCPSPCIYIYILFVYKTKDTSASNWTSRLHQKTARNILYDFYMKCCALCIFFSKLNFQCIEICMVD